MRSVLLRTVGKGVRQWGTRALAHNYPRDSRVCPLLAVTSKTPATSVRCLSKASQTWTEYSKDNNTQSGSPKGNKPKLVGHIFSSGRQVTAALDDPTQGSVGVTWADGGVTHYPYLWLRDNCTCPACYNESSMSRLFPLAGLDVNIKPTGVMVDAGSVKVTWSDGHESSYASDWLEGRSFTAEVQGQRQKWLHPKEHRYWGAEMADSISTFNFEQLLKDDKCLYDWISALEETGLALVQEAPCAPGQLQRIGERVAFLKVTHYGNTFTVKAKVDPSNLAYTSAGLGFHTDLPYYNYTPGMQMLHCIKQVPTEGGENQLTDGFHIAQLLKERHPDMYDLLTSTLIDFQDVGTDYGKFFKIRRAPTIGFDNEGKVNKITLNNMVRDSFLNAPVDVVNKLYVALATYNNIAYEPENHIQYKLQAGEIVCFHNYRVLHGRSGYRILAEGERHLEGGYIDWDELSSRRRVLLADLNLYE